MNPGDPAAVAWCVMGAFFATPTTCDGESHLAAEEALRAACDRLGLLRSVESVAEVSDGPAGHAKITGALRCAIRIERGVPSVREQDAAREVRA